MHDQKLFDRLFDRIRIDNYTGCWEWQGYRLPGGYGQISVAGKTMTTHRAMVLAREGEIPAGRIVCHTCDNRCCVAPRHLYVGTYADNNRDTVRRGRANLEPAWEANRRKARERRKIGDL